MQNIDDFAMKSLSKELKHLKHLNKLTIDISGRAEEINTQLKEINYDINKRIENVRPTRGYQIIENKITDKGIKYLSRCINDYGRDLKDLTLILSFCNIKDQGATYITSKMSQKLKKLTRLNISFGGCNKMSEEGLTQAIKYLRQVLAGLQALTFDLSSCRIITNEILQKLSNPAGRPQHKLQYLAFDISNCDLVTDEGIIYIGEIVAQFYQNLKSLILNFDSCYQVTDKGVEKVVSRISRSLKDLLCIKLNFNWCMSATDHGIMRISQDICQNLLKLTDVSTVCGSYDNGMSDEKIESVDANMSKNLTELRSATSIYVRYLFILIFEEHKV